MIPQQEKKCLERKKTLLCTYHRSRDLRSQLQRLLSGTAPVHGFSASQATPRNPLPLLSRSASQALLSSRFMDAPVKTSWHAITGAIRWHYYMDALVKTSWHTITGAIRSTTFISSFVGIFQGVICLHKKVATKYHKLVYWFAGGYATLTVLLEKKGRRGELGLYVLPRAGESLWYILVNRRLLPDITNDEVLPFVIFMLPKEPPFDFGSLFELKLI